MLYKYEKPSALLFLCPTNILILTLIQSFCCDNQSNNQFNLLFWLIYSSRSLFMHFPTGRSFIYCLHAFICSRASMDTVSNTEEMNVNSLVTHSAMKIANYVYRYARVWLHETLSDFMERSMQLMLYVCLLSMNTFW